MIATATSLADVFVLDPTVHEDERGFLFESFSKREFEQQTGCSGDFVQDNHSHSTQGVLRGLHFQLTQPQAKLVRAIAGAIWDVAVDVDRSSPTYGQYVAVELSAANRRQLYIGNRYAHGFCVLTPTADVLYKCSDYYKPGDGRGVRWDDSDLAIDWPVKDPLLSPQDAALPSLAELD